MDQENKLKCTEFNPSDIYSNGLHRSYEKLDHWIQCDSRVFIHLAIMVYVQLRHALRLW